jgi:hypothetical protein
MKKNFWFKDLWVGDIHYFETLDEARDSASGERGIYNITIYDKDNNRVETVKTGNPYP